jgi:Cdc6-like AAA superfamily ATPase
MTSLPSNPSLLSILSDQPAGEDQLNFDPYAKTLADIVAEPGTDMPLTIGVFGSWGQGKTSLMRMVQQRLEATVGTAFPVRAVWFNAWLYSHQPALWRALISRVLDGVRGFESLSDAARAGGSWYSNNPAVVCRCGYRYRYDPGNWNFFRGFRCARTLSS